MDILHEALGFAAKAFIIFITVTLTAAGVAAIARRRRLGGPRLDVRLLNDRYQALADALRHGTMEKKALRLHLKARRKSLPSTPPARPSVYVLDFKGDILATAVKSLREEVSAISAVATKDDEVVVRLESPGGAVPHYGLAAAQLMRLRDKGIKVTICIDRMAASGGYMMACVADSIIAAPFAIIGSIGVVAQVPNFNRLLKNHDVDFQEMTAGEFKRTVSVFGEITDKGRKKFQDQLEDTHQLFKEFVHSQRPALDVDRVSTGEYWLARRAIDLGLVDHLGTSDDYLIGRVALANVYKVSFEPAVTLRERLGRAAVQTVDRSFLAVLSRLMTLELR